MIEEVVILTGRAHLMLPRCKLNLLRRAYSFDRDLFQCKGVGVVNTL